MIKTSKTLILTCSVLLLLTAAAGQVSAHGTDHKAVDPGPAVAVEFIYADGSPMSYADVLVYSPGDDEIEHQNGRTDANGRFVFYPDEPGKWQIEAGDGTGHLEKASVEVSAQQGEKEASVRENSGGQKSPPGGLDRALMAVLGVSLILNIFSGLYFFQKTGGKT